MKIEQFYKNKKLKKVNYYNFFIFYKLIIKVRQKYNFIYIFEIRKLRTILKIIQFITIFII